MATFRLFLGKIAGVAETITRGGWLHPDQIKANDEHQEKRRKRLRELEETITTAYQRLTGKITEPPIIEAAKDNPAKLAVNAAKLAAQLAEKAKTSDRFRAKNKAIIADLKRMAKEIADQQAEEEAIVLLLA